MFEKVAQANFIAGEHAVLKYWREQRIFDKLREQNAGKPRWSFLDGPITANNPMGVHHAWGRTYKDAFQRFFAMTGHELRYQNGFDCQGLWVEVEVEKELGLGTKSAIHEYGIDRFVNECKKRVLRFAARQTEQSIRLGYWMEWDDPDQLRLLADHIGSDTEITVTTPTGKTETGKAHQLVERLGNPQWGGSYFTFSTENNETIWTFLKKCFRRGKIYQGHDVMPWSGRGGSAYSQMEIAEGRKLTTHKSCFVRFPLVRDAGNGVEAAGGTDRTNTTDMSYRSNTSYPPNQPPTPSSPTNEYLLVWTTTPWTLSSNVAAAVNQDLDYVKVRTTRDGAVYYFAKDNLNYQRLATEFKDGFGRPEWKWPNGVPKLKTIAQIFKEQGGFEELGTIKGAEMVGWKYIGPFDDLPAQQQPGGFPQNDALADRSGVTCHRVIDGGRDSRGNPNVVAGEGTGIVHIAPGCGDVDHKLVAEHGIVAIAPLGEDGCFDDGFGDFTGREAIAPQTAELVFEKLREKHLLVATEVYPHVYPHCWRTGDELVFRLVDEWFINMDWREEIKDVTREITWLPPSIDGQERECEWLSIMGDWMISKKRFWGLALPIWVDEQTGEFEVIGSLAELQARAVAGWDEFEGHSPHRPWIDRVKIRSTKTGNVMSRISDVGNPWLDAGIVPFSTLHYNHDHDEWQKWYPADFVTECFPGQFRNWFYSLLSLSTMMMWEETRAKTPFQKRPFKTLLGHRLVMNEDGRPMHKSDGTAIWFEEAAEQLGVDTMRWMYLAQNPAQDLRFGTRHKDKPITIETPDGPATHTAEGLPVCEVVSKLADEVRRQILIPLWNSYSFFVNYARLDEFDPLASFNRTPQARASSGQPPPDDAPDARACGVRLNDGCVPIADRPEIDRWVLSNLQALIATCRREFENYNTPGVCGAAAAFIDDLSNWYIRRNRRRFWRSRDASDTDKLAAYQTLYEVLVTLSKLLAPCVPFVCERMYENLVVKGLGTLDAHEISKQFRNMELNVPQFHNMLGQLARLGVMSKSAYEAGGEDPIIGFNFVDVPRSVHLCSYPTADDSLLDPELNERMALAQLVVKLGHKLREENMLRVRLPLPELRFASSNAAQREAIEHLAPVIREELNVKQLTCVRNFEDLTHYSFRPNVKTLGPKYGKLLGVIRKELANVAPPILAPLRSGLPVTLTLGGHELTFMPEDVLISSEPAPNWVCTEERGIQIALSTALTPDLQREGMARDFVRHVQQLRKDLNLQIEDRINIKYAYSEPAHAVQELKLAINAWNEYIRTETLAESLEDDVRGMDDPKIVWIGDVQIGISILKAAK